MCINTNIDINININIHIHINININGLYYTIENSPRIGLSTLWSTQAYIEIAPA